MKTQIQRLFIGLVLFAGVNALTAQNTAFTYQGRVTDNGTNFNGSGQFEFALVTSTNTSATATATANAPSGGYITGYAVTYAGNGYTGSTVPLTITGGGGSGAAAHGNISGGAVTSITVDNPGNGLYTSTPTVTIAAPPADIAYTTYWSNDGTISGEPSAAVNVNVADGLFTVVLGDTNTANMTAIDASLFSQPNLQLRIWFNDGVHGFAALDPAQNLTPAPYAVMAESASNLLGTLPVAQLSGTVGNGQLANNAITVNAGTGLSGGGVVALGSSTTLNNAGVTSLTGGGGVTVSAASGAVTLGSTATSADTANAIVSRDGSGNFSAGSITLNGNLDLPATSASVGIIYSGGALFMHAYGTQNFFAGANAGNLTLAGHANTGVGWQALFSDINGDENAAFGTAALEFNTSGDENTAIGNGVMEFNTSGSGNTANGYQALNANTSGYANTASGYQTLFDNTNGWANEAFGYWALEHNLSGYQNTSVGDYTLNANTTGYQNTAVGSGALQLNVNGFENTAEGFHALWQLGLANGAGGTNNIAIGYLAASQFTANESGNIDIGNAGTAGESGVIRIGTPGIQTATYLAGTIHGNGGGLTNLNLSALPAAVVTNNETTSVDLNNLTLDGSLTLPAITATSSNVIYSGGSLLMYADDSENFFIGPGAGNLTTSGYANTANGAGALSANTSGYNNTANGADGPLYYNTSGYNNTAIGYDALGYLGFNSYAGGTNNIALGYNAGSAFTADESANIDIGNNGVSGESGVIRIGTEGLQKNTFLVGNVGLNEANPAGALHITGPTNAPPDGVGSGDNGLVLGTTGTSGYKWIQSYGGPLVLNGPGNNVSIGNENPPNDLLVVGTGGAYCNGTTWVNGSDRNSKQDFTAINPREVLAKVSAMPITEWKYKVEADGIEHIGPMAQDFHAAFGLNGADDKHISTVDEGGVALAAIQGLNEKLQETRAENTELKQRLDRLEQIILKQKSN